MELISDNAIHRVVMVTFDIYLWYNVIQSAANITHKSI